MTLSEQIKSGFEDLKGLFAKTPVSQADLDNLQATNTQLKSDLEAERVKLVQNESDLATAKQTISSLTAEKDKAVADLTAANTKLSEVPIQIKTAASAQAAQIVASVGTPPVAATAPAQATENKPEAKGRERFIQSIKIN